MARKNKDKSNAPGTRNLFLKEGGSQEYEHRTTPYQNSNDPMNIMAFKMPKVGKFVGPMGNQTKFFKFFNQGQTPSPVGGPTPQPTPDPSTGPSISWDKRKPKPRPRGNKRGAQGNNILDPGAFV